MATERAVRPPAGHRRGRVHRLVLRPRRPRPPRRDPDHGPRQADLRRQRGEPGAGPRRPGAGGAVRASSAATSPTRRSSGRSSPTADAVVNFAAESHVDRSILDPEAFLRDRRHRRPRPARGVPDGARRGRASSRSRPTRSTARSTTGHAARGRPRSRRARRTRRPRRPASCSSAATSSPTASTRSSPAARTRTARTTTPRSSSRCSSPTRIDDQPLPLYGDGLQRRDWLYVVDHAAGDRPRPAPRRDAARPTTSPAAPSGRTARSSRSCSSASASRGRWSARSRTGPATTGATRWTARSSRRSAGGRRPSFEDGLAATVDWYRANEAWWRAARSGDWDG